MAEISSAGLMIVELLSREWGISTDSHGFKTVCASFLTTAPSPS